MQHKTHCLSPDEMHVFLDGQLSQAEDSTLIGHLDRCPKCREALERNAGGPQWLGHVKEFLGDASFVGPVEQPHLAINVAARRRFAREARAAAAVVHDHVVPIYAVNEFRGFP